MTTSFNTISPAAASSSSSAGPSSAVPTPDPLANQQTFLQLLVTQLKNQDPLKPQDGLQFVTQLAQFSQLEQSIHQTQDLTGIESLLKQIASAGATSLGGH